MHGMAGGEARGTTEGCVWCERERLRDGEQRERERESVNDYRIADSQSHREVMPRASMPHRDKARPSPTRLPTSSRYSRGAGVGRISASPSPLVPSEVLSDCQTPAWPDAERQGPSGSEIARGITAGRGPRHFDIASPTGSAPPGPSDSISQQPARRTSS